LRKKDESIETLRAVAIILVVAFHIGNDPELDSSRALYDHFSYFFQNIRLPLFTIISGYLYACRPIADGKFSTFIGGKARRILVPLIAVSTVEYLIVSLAPGVNNPANLADIWKIYLFPYEHYWFLQAIFLIFIVVVLLEFTSVLDKFPGYLIVLLLAFAVSHLYYYYKPPFNLFSFGGFTYLLPYFLVGVGLKRFSTILASNKAGFISAIIFSLLILLQYMLLDTDYASLFAKGQLLGMAVGLFCGIFLFSWKPALKPLAWLGSYAYTIYLYQSFGAGFARRAFGGLDATSDHLYFFLVLLVTLLAGVMIEEVVKRMPYIRKVLLGLK